MPSIFKEWGAIKLVDFGCYNVTGRDIDRHRFRVPGLRNVAVTPPYFHDDSIDELDETIRVMGRYQLGVDLVREDVRSMVAFLESLTGEYKGKSL